MPSLAEIADDLEEIEISVFRQRGGGGTLTTFEVTPAANQSSFASLGRLLGRLAGGIGMLFTPMNSGPPGTGDLYGSRFDPRNAEPAPVLEPEPITPPPVEPVVVPAIPTPEPEPVTFPDEEPANDPFYWPEPANDPVYDPVPVVIPEIIPHEPPANDPEYRPAPESPGNPRIAPDPFSDPFGNPGISPRFDPARPYSPPVLPNPYPDPFAVPWGPASPRTVEFPQPSDQPRPNTRTAPRPSPSPEPAPFVSPVPNPLADPFADPLPSLDLQPDPLPVGDWEPFGMDTTVPDLTGKTADAPPSPQQCNCAQAKPKTDRKKRKPRTECWQGTYTQRAQGTVFTPVRKVQCVGTPPRSTSQAVKKMQEAKEREKLRWRQHLQRDEMKEAQHRISHKLHMAADRVKKKLEKKEFREKADHYREIIRVLKSRLPRNQRAVHFDHPL